MEEETRTTYFSTQVGVINAKLTSSNMVDHYNFLKENKDYVLKYTTVQQELAGCVYEIMYDLKHNSEISDWYKKYYYDKFGKEIELILSQQEKLQQAYETDNFEPERAKLDNIVDEIFTKPENAQLVEDSLSGFGQLFYGYYFV